MVTKFTGEFYELFLLLFLNGQFLVDSCHNDANELYAILEIRRFDQHYHEVWPYWFFFCDLDTETLQMMTLCLLPNLTGIKRLGEPKAGVQYDSLDLIRFIEIKLRAHKQHDGASLHKRDGHLPTHWDVFLYFNLPFDAQPQFSSLVKSYR